MRALVEFNQADHSCGEVRDAGKCAIDPDEVAAVLERRPSRGSESSSTVVLKSGVKVELNADPGFVRKRLAR